MIFPFQPKTCCDVQTLILGLFLNLGVYSALLYVSHCFTTENLRLEREILYWLQFELAECKTPVV